MHDHQKGTHRHGRRSARSVLNAEFIMEKWGPAPGESVLDIGCGDGFLALAAAAATGPAGKVVGVDIDKEWLNDSTQTAAELGLNNVEFRFGDATRELPVADASVDYALLSNILHDLVEHDDVAPVIKEIARVVRPGGRLFVIDFKKAPTPFGPPVEIRVSPDEVANLIEPFGFTFQSADKVGVYHHGTFLVRN